MNWQELAFQVAVVIALVTWIKKLTGDTLGHYYMLISMGVAFIIVLLATIGNFVATDFIKQSLIVGLTASGTFDVASRMANK